MPLIEIKELIMQSDPAKLDLVLSKMETIMATLDQIIADVNAESSQLDSVSTLMAGIEQQLKDALSGTTLPPTVQAKVDAIFAQTEANAAKIAQARGNWQSSRGNDSNPRLAEQTRVVSQKPFRV